MKTQSEKSRESTKNKLISKRNNEIAESFMRGSSLISLSNDFMLDISEIEVILRKYMRMKACEVHDQINKKNNAVPNFIKILKKKGVDITDII